MCRGILRDEPLGASYSLTVVACDLEMLIFEVRVQSLLTKCQNRSTKLFYKTFFLYKSPLNSWDKRYPEKLTVYRQMIENLSVNRQNDLFLTVNRQRDPPSYWDPLLRSKQTRSEQQELYRNCVVITAIDTINSA